MLGSYILAVPAFVYFMSVSGTGNTGVALRIEVLSVFIYTCATIWIVVVQHADVAWCWTTEFVYDGMILTSYLYLLKGNWRNKRI